MTREEYSEQELQDNINTLHRVGQNEYMRDVRRCAMRVDGSCGGSATCSMCKHNRMISRMVEEYKNIKENESVDFYTMHGSKDAVRAYILGFEVGIEI